MVQRLSYALTWALSFGLGYQLSGTPSGGGGSTPITNGALFALMEDI